MRCTVTARPTFADGVLTPHAKTARSRRRVTLKGRALVAYKAAAARLDTPIVFPAPQGGYLSIDNFRDRDWYPVLEAAAIDKRGPYQLGPTFATEALASGLSKTVTPTARAFEANIVALAPGVMAGATALAAGGVDLLLTMSPWWQTLATGGKGSGRFKRAFEPFTPRSFASGCDRWVP